MPYEKLLRPNRIKPHPINKRQIDQLLHLAARDIDAAVGTQENAPDWAYSIAYNAILQAGKALMFSEDTGHAAANSMPR